MSSESILISRPGAPTDGVLQLSLNRPERRNAITAEMYGALADAIFAAEGDPSVKAAYTAAKSAAAPSATRSSSARERAWSRA